ncbi:hypothetical protein V6N13_009237 [Hibiscus sabdariffa]|uniref:Uncharacterized protein n=1 Tax=Hibiscus sabdariffa TaxID=183260 RepID=A0ABR1ZR55_9ROSI
MGSTSRFSMCVSRCGPVRAYPLSYPYLADPDSSITYLSTVAGCSAPNYRFTRGLQGHGKFSSQSYLLLPLSDLTWDLIQKEEAKYRAMSSVKK